MRTTLMTTAACLVCLGAASLAEATIILQEPSTAGTLTSFGTAEACPVGTISQVDTSVAGTWGGSITIDDNNLGLATATSGTASTAWRIRTAGETWSTESSPPMPVPGIALASDVVQVSGISGAYVLEMGYNEGMATAEAAFNEGLFYLGTLPSPGTGTKWQNADTLGTKGSSTTSQDQGVYNSSYANFASSNNINAGNLANYAGSWGVDFADGNAWCILDANLTAGGIGAQQFAVVPEPGTMSLFGSGALGLALWGVKRRRANRTTRSQEVRHALCA